MITLIFSVDAKITEIMINHFELIKLANDEQLGSFSIYKKGGTILFESQKDEKSFRQAFLYAYSEYNPDVIIYTGTASKIGTEVKNGDVILPNVFFEYNKKIGNIELDKENRDTFLKDPIFLEQYALQNDYNFENFGLSIGGICVTYQNEIEMIYENIEKIRVAYENDVMDNYSYIFLDEAKKLDLLAKTYVVLGAKSHEEEVSIDHISHIVSFILDNISGKEEEVGELEEDEI